MEPKISHPHSSHQPSRINLHTFSSCSLTNDKESFSGHVGFSGLKNVYLFSFFPAGSVNYLSAILWIPVAVLNT